LDAKVEHLKLIQGTISRLAGNSFLLRGWTVTLVAALFAFGAKEADRVFVVIAWVPLLVFAGLDAYYVMQERLYRDLYTTVAAKPEAATDYSMDTTPFQMDRTWWRSLVSTTVLGFYLPMAGLLSLLTVYFALSPKPEHVPAQGPKTITISIQ
jgi:hypothetical protein